MFTLAEQLKELDKRGRTIAGIVNRSGGIAIGDLLAQSADVHRTTSGEMKYALSYGNVKNMYVIDFYTGTVQPNTYTREASTIETLPVRYGD